MVQPLAIPAGPLRFADRSQVLTTVAPGGPLCPGCRSNYTLFRQFKPGNVKPIEGMVEGTKISGAHRDAPGQPPPPAASRRRRRSRSRSRSRSAAACGNTRRKSGSHTLETSRAASTLAAVSLDASRIALRCRHCPCERFCPGQPFLLRCRPPVRALLAVGRDGLEGSRRAGAEREHRRVDRRTAARCVAHPTVVARMTRLRTLSFGANKHWFYAHRTLEP